MTMQAAEHEGDLIEYPDGRTARIDAQGNIIGGDTVPAPAPDLFDGVEVLSDPFPVTGHALGTWFDFDAESGESDVVETARTAKPILQLLKSLPEEDTALQIAKRFDATTLNSAEETHAASDALIAIVRLRQMCTQMIETPTPINAEECLAFIEQAKQRLNVVSLACPFLKCAAELPPACDCNRSGINGTHEDCCATVVY